MGTNKNLLRRKYPPSEPCNCDICRTYCARPGWWTVEEAQRAFEAGLGSRMMLEVAPGFAYGVLSPAFRGCEKNFALQEYASYGCNFYNGGLCELYGTGLEPLECLFCHHTRIGEGIKCHADIEKDWNTPEGQALVFLWGNSVGLWARYGLII